MTIPNGIGGEAARQLRSYVERIERLEEEKRGIASDIREVYAEAKGHGFDPGTMRRIVKERRLDRADREEREALLELYRGALGMLSGTPLGDAAEAATAAPPPPPSKRQRKAMETGDADA